MICTNCSKAVPDTANVCGYCGNRLRRPPSESAEGQPLPNTRPSRPVATQPASASSAPPAATPEQPTSTSETRGPRYRGLQVLAAIGLVVTAVLTVDIFTCGFRMNELSTGSGSRCQADLASFWMFAFAPAVLFVAILWWADWTGAGGIRTWTLAILAVLGVALAAWAIVFFDASYWCSGTISGRPLADSSSTFCAIEWGRIVAYAFMGLVFLLCLGYIAIAGMRARARR